MVKHLHEIRDPIHTFIRVDSMERKVLDSRPFQRLRYIHQLALTYLLYPGATHRRFEHSLGVMELAGRVYDVVTDSRKVHHEMVRGLLPLPGSYEHYYWRRALRMAALCHDVGHLPFSHAAERQLLPPGWSHERLTADLIRGEEMAPAWQAVKVLADDVAKLAVGPDYFTGGDLSPWERALSQIITSEALGVDRIDYLLRDAYHAGVGHGRFDHTGLVHNLRLLVVDQDQDRMPRLGVEAEGLVGAEALLMARYFMYQQVYLHPVRRILDLHLREFLAAWLPQGRFATDLADHLRMTDNEVMVALHQADRDPARPGHDPARRLLRREHFRLLYQANALDLARAADVGLMIYEAVAKEFGRDKVRYVFWKEAERESMDFPVRWRDGRVLSALGLSDTLRNLPRAESNAVYLAPTDPAVIAGWRAAQWKTLFS